MQNQTSWKAGKMIGQCILRNLQVMTLLSVERLGLKMSEISSNDSGLQYFVGLTIYGT